MKYMDDMKKLGQRIRERRQELNLSQPQLAEYAGLSAGHIAQIERGEIVPTLPTVQELERVLEIPLFPLLSVYDEQESGNEPMEEVFRNLGRAVDQKLMGEEKQTVSRAVNLLTRKIDPKVGEHGKTK